METRTFSTGQRAALYVLISRTELHGGVRQIRINLGKIYPFFPCEPASSGICQYLCECTRIRSSTDPMYILCILKT